MRLTSTVVLVCALLAPAAGRAQEANPSPRPPADLSTRVLELEGRVERLTRRLEVIEAAQANAAGPDTQVRSGKDLAWQFDGYTGESPFKVSQQELDRKSGTVEVLLQLVAEPKDAAAWRAAEPGAPLPLEVTATLSGGAMQGPIPFVLKRKTGLDVGRQVHIHAQLPEGDAKAVRRLVVRHRDPP
jgi:hypothetical protein